MPDNYGFLADFISKKYLCDDMGVSISFYFILHNDTSPNNNKKKTKGSLF